MVLSRSVNTDLFNEAMAAYEREEYAAAFKLIRSLALGGDARAQCLLGFMYYQGEGTDKNLHKAYKWLNRSAMKGFPEARNARDLLGDLILQTGSTLDINHMQDIFKQSMIDRRSGMDRRGADDSKYVKGGGIERRSLRDRRKISNRRSSPRFSMGE